MLLEKGKHITVLRMKFRKGQGIDHCGKSVPQKVNECVIKWCTSTFNHSLHLYNLDFFPHCIYILCPLRLRMVFDM